MSPPRTSGSPSARACARSSTSSATPPTAWRPTRARCRTSTACDRRRRARQAAAAGRPHHLPASLHADDLRHLRRLPPGSDFRGTRKTPIDPWAEAHGAVFEPVALWRRAWYFPKPGEDMHAAVARECRATRASLGIFDASTLGKIEVVGPDAVDLHGADVHQPLGEARSRALPLRPAARRGRLHPRRRRHRPPRRRPLPRHHHHRRRGARAQHDGGLSPDRMARPEGLAHLDHRAVGRRRAQRPERPQADRALRRGPRPLRRGLPAHVGRRMHGLPASRRGSSASPSPASSASRSTSRPATAAPLWEKLWEAGQQYDICAYGTETMHVLRAEKGYIIVGQDTDGTLTPDDAGLGLGDRQGQARLRRQALARPPRHGGEGPQAARRPSHRRPEGRPPGRRPDRRRPEPAEADDHARPRHLLLLERGARPLDRHGGRRRRPRPRRPDAARADAGPHAHAPGSSRARPSTTPKATASAPDTESTNERHDTPQLPPPV